MIGTWSQEKRTINLKGVWGWLRLHFWRQGKDTVLHAWCSEEGGNDMTACVAVVLRHSLTIKDTSVLHSLEASQGLPVRIDVLLILRDHAYVYVSELGMWLGHRMW